MKHFNQSTGLLWCVLCLSLLLTGCEKNTYDLSDPSLLIESAPLSYVMTDDPEPIGTFIMQQNNGPDLSEAQGARTAQANCMIPPFPAFHTILYMGRETYYPPFDIPVVRVGSSEEIPFATSYTWVVEYQGVGGTNCMEKYTGSTHPSVLLYVSFLEKHGPVRITRIALKGEAGHPLGLSNTFHFDVDHL